jgi:hypothetical protein
MVALAPIAIGSADGLSGKPTSLEQQAMRPARARDQMLEHAQGLAKGRATTAAATAATAFGSFL